MGMSSLFSFKAQLILLVLVAVGFDFGLQATLIAHQTIVLSIVPEARSRANALLFTLMFLGMAAGSTLGVDGRRGFCNSGLGKRVVGAPCME
jgi:predicted MFS family arabinose efflux permease